jgi:hypothetical protein
LRGTFKGEVMKSEEINKLPEKVRAYIHDLQTNCDPSGNIQTIASLKEQVGGLEFKCNSYFACLADMKGSLINNGELDLDTFEYLSRSYNIEI